MALEGEPAATVWRGPVAENVHRAIIAVAKPDGRVTASLGDTAAVAYTRSSAKPFQALALVASGAAEALDVTDRELAVIAGSHAGQDLHVKTVEGLLAKAGAGPDALQCGVHRPFHKPTAARIGDKATVLHHNCSGKHAGMLLLARHLGTPASTYIQAASPGQRLIRRTLADVAGLRAPQVRVGTDGCSAPNFALPMRNVARAYACLAAPDEAPRHTDALRRVRDAMLANPEMVGGDDRFDTALMSAYAGEVVSKSGADGFEGLGLPRKGLGVAVKVVDGTSRVVPPVVVRTLKALRVRGLRAPELLEPFLGRSMKNWAGREVGRIEARFELRPHGPRSARR